MKTLISLAAGGLLLAGGSAAAQDVPAQPPATPEPIQTTPVPPSTSTAPEMAEREFSDEEVAGFAAAAMRMRELRANEELDDAAKRAAAEAIVAEEGLDPETYQAIGTSSQNDPALAQRIQMAIAAMEENPGE